ncbi:rhomboid family intramembrane serine protease [Chryseobacterium sp. Hurlbut01]|jgi:membrane associated rhomboid family serine protease|uniref:rhomboid family intramembrane serine protease n=1 Tax=Chryseobacterium sp. Hurlbut01 TaxID=1681828 RepID=UPI00067B4125|nr:rhomboid family intramembrane serine protease [Chryseobacterium sp. Hurlbut01]KNB62115.1 membrane protein [Chryseobacterium sp. Hurlbut01]
MFNNITPITRNLIIINIVVFIASFLLPQLNDTLAAYFPFSPNFRSWQIITHMFMHGSFMHILFNMFTLFSFGPILEQSLGDKKYLILYFLSGLGAFFLYNLWNFVEYQQIYSQLESVGFNVSGYISDPESFINTKVSTSTKELIDELNSIIFGRMVGASGAIFGVIAAFATLYPDAKIGILFIPIPVKVKYVLPIVVIGSIYLGVTGNGGGIAHLAHVGGAIVGFILAKIWRKHLYRFN